MTLMQRKNDKQTDSSMIIESNNIEDYGLEFLIESNTNYGFNGVIISETIAREIGKKRKIDYRIFRNIEKGIII